jgi:hypothetical protein
MKTKKPTKHWFAMTLLVCSMSFNVNAASILIDAGNITSLVTFTFGQFEGGFSINGSTPTSGGSFTFGNGTQLNFTGQWLDLGQSTPFSRTVYWEDQNAPNVIEQIFQWSITPSGPSGLSTISGLFQAEGLGTIPPGVPVGDIIVLQPDGSHNPFSFSAPFLTGNIIADIPRPLPPVPIPAAAWLFGTALIGLVGFSKRRKSA